MSAKYFCDYKRLSALFSSGRMFVAFDTETTGLRAQSDFIIEIGAVKFSRDGLLGEPFDCLVKPPVRIPPIITGITGIDDAMVEGCGGEDEAVWRFARYAGGAALVAHNAPFDVGFVGAALERALLPPLDNLVVDTLKASRWAYPDLSKSGEKGRYKLQALASFFHIEVTRAHRASDDARVCMELFKRIAKDSAAVCPPAAADGGAQLALL